MKTTPPSLPLLNFLLKIEVNKAARSAEGFFLNLNWLSKSKSLFSGYSEYWQWPSKSPFYIFSIIHKKSCYATLTFNVVYSKKNTELLRKMFSLPVDLSDSQSCWIDHEQTPFKPCYFLWLTMGCGLQF